MTRTSSLRIAGVCPIVLALSTGCSHDSKPPAAPAVQEARTADTALVAKPEAAPQSTVKVDPDILAACKITIAESRAVSAKGAPLFAFDSAALPPADRSVLSQVARCFTTGPLSGRSVKLTGRADPRGTEDYNMRLGDQRATSVMRYLERQGLPASQVTESSRGAMDASGHDEQGWAEDRRVDVDLAAR